ncbi:hypothetical protein [Chryseobacterium indologenes]|uniref:hypothetical protein n=1 Tax=Chryseobacterium indologenes TaxID=253 RepID=UPI0016273F7F|nr:hypothetical protein [Chryseobacterium indologenes]
MKTIYLLCFFFFGSVYCQQLSIPSYTKSTIHWKEIREIESKSGAIIPLCGLIHGDEYIDYGSSAGAQHKEIYCNGLKGSKKLENNILYYFDLQTNSRDANDTDTNIDLIQQFKIIWSCDSQNIAALQQLTDLYNQIIKDYKMESVKHNYKNYKEAKGGAFSKDVSLVQNKKTDKTNLTYKGLVDGVNLPNNMKNSTYLKRCNDVKNLDKK